MGTSDMDRMEWRRIFQSKARDLSTRHSWSLEFDDTLVPNSLNPGWQQYIKNSGARFRCSLCGRRWPSNRVMVVFHMHLRGGQGIVKMRRFRQNCKICPAAPMETPSITPENIERALENLMNNIRIKFYNEALERGNRSFVPFDVKSPHEPANCEGCQAGICNELNPC